MREDADTVGGMNTDAGHDPKPRLGLWLLFWGWMVVTLVVPLALAAGGVWTWDIAWGVSGGCWLIALMGLELWHLLRREPWRRRRKRKAP